MSHIRPTEKVSDNDASSKRGKGASPSRKRNLIVLAVLSIIVCVVVIVAVFASVPSSSLEIKNGENFQYSIEGYESGANVSGSMRVEVTSVSSNSFTVTYTVTLENNTNKTESTFSDASGDWSANAGSVIGRISGTSASGEAGNATNYTTWYGVKNLRMYTITNDQSGTNILFQYWLDTTTNCPYLMTMTWPNGDILTFTLVYTNISEFT